MCNNNSWCHDPCVKLVERLSFGPADETCGLGPLAIDVVKTRIQIDPALKGANMIRAGQSIVLNEGPRGLLTGVLLLLLASL